MWFNDIIKYKFFTDQVSFPPSCIKANIDLELLNDYYEGTYGRKTNYFNKKLHIISWKDYN